MDPKGADQISTWELGMKMCFLRGQVCISRRYIGQNQKFSFPCALAMAEISETPKSYLRSVLDFEILGWTVLRGKIK